MPRDLTAGFSVIPNTIIRCGDLLDPAEYRVLMTILSYIDRDADSGWAFITTIAVGQDKKPNDHGCGFQPRYVKKVLARLAKKGVLSRSPDSRDGANTFTINWNYFNSVREDIPLVSGKTPPTNVSGDTPLVSGETSPSVREATPLVSPETPEKEPYRKNPTERTLQLQPDIAVANAGKVASSTTEQFNYWKGKGYRLGKKQIEECNSIYKELGRDYPTLDHLLEPVSVRTALGRKEMPRWKSILQNKSRMAKPAVSPDMIYVTDSLLALWADIKWIGQPPATPKRESLLPHIQSLLEDDKDFPAKMVDLFARIGAEGNNVRDRAECGWFTLLWLVRKRPADKVAENGLKRGYDVVLARSDTHKTRKGSAPVAGHIDPSQPFDFLAQMKAAFKTQKGNK